MSVVCSKVYNDRIVIAADSIVICGTSKEPNKNFSKLETINEMIIGGVGTCQELSLMYHFARTHKPLDATDKSVFEFIIEFCKFKKDLTNEFNMDSYYLICYQGKLFAIQDFFVREIKDYYAIGAGDGFAKAALYLGHTPKEAVKTACDISCFVAEPIVVEEMAK